ncbi:hypothetical protein LINPERHAP2_LOCUS7479 [Linum perenne]
MMEANEGKEGSGLLHQILPPRLEDAGLEDCALPPESIKEAFLKAASAVKCRARSIFTQDEDNSDGECVQDPSDVMVGADALVGGIKEGLDDKGSSCCLAGVDDVVDKDKGRDKVVVLGGVGVDDDVDDKTGDEEEEEEEEEEKGPILTGGFV